ncbi:MAG: dihydrofolate reductase [Candidatus Doudnabacteria bacterium]|nr:dihydrofolate reductase [Candidatus Doudnabacteria bacterium]
MIILVAAVAKNNVIGKENDLPWYLPEDLKRFKRLTTGKTVLMGRKTYDSIIRRLGKPLPNRKNVVVTRDANFKAPEGVEIYHSLDAALAKYGNEHLFVIGGGEIYRQTIDRADKLEITHVDQQIDGDAFFPEIDEKKWKKTEEEPHEGYTFVTYERN